MEWYLSVRQSGIAMAYNAAGFHAAVVYYCVEPHTSASYTKCS